jgi:methionyl-tRNA formyltransferase
MLFNWVRALTHPYPGAFTFYKGKKVLVWEARIAHHGKSSREYITAKTLKPGTVVGTEDGLLVLVGGDELISIHRLNVEFEEEQSWPDFVDKYQVVHGDCFDNRGVVTS